MSDNNMNEKDKLYRTIRRLLIIGAISIGVLFIGGVIGSVVLGRIEAKQLEQFYEGFDKNN